MIFLDRSNAKEPVWFRSTACEELRSRLSAHFALPVKERPQLGREIFSIEKIRKAADDALLKWTYGKCAYCESTLGKENPYNLEMFRPLRVDDAKARDHYWWLATEWDNLLPICSKCNTAKRNLFPIEGERCNTGETGEILDRERPLLIDPSRDRPERELVVMRDGTLFPVRASNTLPTRGLVTIQVLQLNRAELVRHRREVVDAVASLADAAYGDARGRSALLAEEIVNHVKPGAPFASAARFELARFFISQPVTSPKRFIHRTIDAFVRPYVECLQQAELIETSLRPSESEVEQPRKRRRRGAHSKQYEAVTLPLRAAKSHPPQFTVDRVRRVTLESFRAIRKVDFNLPLVRPRDLVSAWRERLQGVVGMDDLVERREWGWKMLLGENGAGKSSIVQAIAIALMGQEFWEKRRADYGLDHSLRAGATRGLIRVELEESEPVEIAITKRGLVWRKRPEGVPVFLRGYGATRLLPRRGATGDARTSGAPPAPIARVVDSLFDPRAPLIDAEAWLRSLGEHDFHAAATNLKALLDLPEKEADFGFEERPARKGRFGLWRSRGKRRFAAFEPLDHFSAGYQTLLALGCDVMAGSGRTIGETRELPGIVLLDEIGTNLHPRWRLAIVRRLGNCFPRIQFIASTHEPLCLRGLGEREVAVVRRVEDEVTVQDDLPSPAGLRVDQLLTSPYFGLDTTSDPAMQRAADVYYQLLSRGDALHADERQLLDELRVLLDTAQLLGSTRREQLLLSAVDQAVAEERKSAKGRPLGASKELRDVARRMLGTLGPKRAPRPRSRR